MEEYFNAEILVTNRAIDYWNRMLSVYKNIGPRLSADEKEPYLNKLYTTKKVL